MNNVNFQKIPSKYIDKLKTFLSERYLFEYHVIYENEKFFSNFLKCKTFKFVNSGTSALYLIMHYISRYLLKKEKLKVVGPAFCHPAWINVCRWFDFDFDFIDVNKKTLSLDPKELESYIQTNNVDVVVLIDMGGYIGEDSFKVKQICEENNIILIEDAANAFGQKYKGVYAGTIGDFAFFSFSNPKLLTSGEGGAIVSSKWNLNDVFENFIYQGGWYKSRRQKFLDTGLNFIMPNFMTQLLRWQLEDIDEAMLNRHKQYITYKQKFRDIIFSYESDNKYYSPSLFIIYDENKVKQNLYMKLGFGYKLYKNMASYFTNKVCYHSQKLEDNLFYLRIE